MASVSKDKKGNRTIQFVDKNRRRQSIRLTKILGKVSAKVANEVKAKVEALNAAHVAAQSWDRETAEWVSKVGPKLYDKLSEFDLVPKRAAATKAALGSFIDTYIKGRADVKPGTANIYHQTRSALVEYFGAGKLLAEITSGDADDWRRWLATAEGRADGSTRGKLGENTIRRRCGVARQFFRAALRKRLIADNPFGEMKGVSVRANKSRDYFVSRSEASKVLEACPDAQWRVLFALSRYAGLRCPSETLALRWADVDLAAGRMVVRSPKTEHLGEEHAARVVPIFPELRPYLEDAEALAPAGAEFVISRYREANANLRTQLNRIIEKAGLKPWPKLFQNLRATRATELVAQHPAHVAAEWLGHSQLVAQEHYWRTTDADFEKATAEPAEALHDAVQSAAAASGQQMSGGPLDSENADLCGVSGGSGVVRAGFEPGAYCTEMGDSSSHRASQTGADCPEVDADLAVIIAAWPYLDADARNEIVAIAAARAPAPAPVQP